MRQGEDSWRGRDGFLPVKLQSTQAKGLNHSSDAMRLLRHNWQPFAALGLAFCLVALLLHPMPAHGPALAGFVLLPVLLFGLVVVPRSLWPAAELDQNFAAPILCRANLFQRPPPSCKN
jgi:hypothetical protein